MCASDTYHPSMCASDTVTTPLCVQVTLTTPVSEQVTLRVYLCDMSPQNTYMSEMDASISFLEWNGWDGDGYNFTLSSSFVAFRRGELLAAVSSGVF